MQWIKTSFNATVLVVGADDKVETRPIVASQAIGDKWLVTYTFGFTGRSELDTAFNRAAGGDTSLGIVVSSYFG